MDMDIRHLKISNIPTEYKHEDVINKLSNIKDLVLGACSMHCTGTSSSMPWSMILTVEQSKFSILKKECVAKLERDSCNIYEIEIHKISFSAEDNLVKRTPSLEPLVRESEMVLNEQIPKNKNKDMPVQFEHKIDSEVADTCLEIVFASRKFKGSEHCSALVNSLRQKMPFEITKETIKVGTMERPCFRTTISISTLPSHICGISEASRKQDSIMIANTSLIKAIYAAAGREIPDWIQRMEN